MRVLAVILIALMLPLSTTVPVGGGVFRPRVLCKLPEDRSDESVELL